MPPVIMWVVGAVGAAVAAKWLAKEWRRVNAELDAVRAQSAGEPRTERKNLKRDPETGIYRPR
jgi:hypothetical protein